MGNGVISAEGLAMKLANAKKIMDTDVKSIKKNNINYDMGYEDDNINENVIYSDSQGLLDTQQITNTPPKLNALSIDKINESKLPENIKKIMIEKPIIQPEISLTNSLDMKLVQKAKKLMDDGNSGKQLQESRQLPRQPIVNNNININEMVNALTPIIENSIRKILDEKLTQILTAKDTASINENLVLKVGDSIFKGKITGVKSSK